MCLVSVLFSGPARDPKMVKKHLPSTSLWVTTLPKNRGAFAKPSPAAAGKMGAEGTSREGGTQGSKERKGQLKIAKARDSTAAPPPGTHEVHFLQEGIVIWPREFPTAPLQLKNCQAPIWISKCLRPPKDLHFNTLKFLEEWRVVRVRAPPTSPPQELLRCICSWRTSLKT